jgi:hypothetical protein
MFTFQHCFKKQISSFSRIHHLAVRGVQGGKAKEPKHETQAAKRHAPPQLFTLQGKRNEAVG